MSRFPGTITFSIDWELDLTKGTTADLGRLDEWTPALVEILDGLQIPATWGVADPARSAATEAILASKQKHELAVLGDRSWLGWGAGGSRSNRELTRRILSAASRQIPIHSLLLHHEASLPPGLPLFELGIRVIRQPLELEVVRSTNLAALPAGIKLAERVQRLMLPRWWNWWDAELRLADLFFNRGAGEMVAHLGIDAEQLCGAGPRGLLRLERLLTELKRRCTQAGWRTATLATWTTQTVLPGRFVA